MLARPRPPDKRSSRPDRPGLAAAHQRVADGVAWAHQRRAHSRRSCRARSSRWARGCSSPQEAG